MAQWSMSLTLLRRLWFQLKRGIKKHTSEPPAFNMKQPDRWTVCFDFFFLSFFLVNPKSAQKSNLVLKLAGVPFPFVAGETMSWAPALAEATADPACVKWRAAFKERSSGKLVEPAGNKIQAEPHPSSSPPPPRSTPSNDTSAQLAVTASFCCHPYEQPGGKKEL